MSENSDRLAKAIDAQVSAAVLLQDAWRAYADGDDVSPEGFTAVYRIPGTFYAEYRGSSDAGTIVRLTFVPAAGDAGYFGPVAAYHAIVDGEPEQAADLEVSHPGGAFWSAMQAALEECTDYDIDGNANTRTTTMVPIGWVE